ncbi:hypothetical protein CLOM_g13847 [Closterium sp. NIES-68]|nr:hypothetical protein CLOM_g13847 [Closterium sp. NIES-68]
MADLIPPLAWLHITVGAVGGLIMTYTFMMRKLKEGLLISESFAALVVGVLLGPHCISVLDPRGALGEATDLAVLRELSRVVLAVQLVSAGLGLPLRYVERQWRSLAVLLGPTMLATWAIAFAIALWLLPHAGASWQLCLLVAACLTPTDPVLASTILQGRFAELAAALHAAGGERRQRRHGATVRHAAHHAHPAALSAPRPHALARCWLCLPGASGVLAVFVATIAFSSREPTAEEGRYDAINGLEIIATVSYFTYLGAVLPFPAWRAIGIPRLLLFALLVLLLRRLPVLLALAPWLPDLHRQTLSKRALYCQAGFAGFFGPIGVGAVLYATQAYEELDGDATAAHVVLLCGGVRSGARGHCRPAVPPAVLVYKEGGGRAQAEAAAATAAAGIW